jgi:hypothetical protein
MKKVYLYGISNIENRYEIKGYSYIEEGRISISNLKAHAAWLRMNFAGVDSVYAIDERPGLAYDYKSTKRKNTFVANHAFRDILEREGLKIL